MRAGPVAGIVLAAGAGRRFGGPKALVRCGPELLVERAVRLVAAGGCDPVLAMLGAGAAEVLTGADLGAAAPIVVADWADGMGASLRAALAAADDAGAGAALVLLADQPLIGVGAVLALRSAWSAGAVAAVATYAGAPGHPVLFDRAVWPGVVAGAVGDVGARQWLRNHPDLVTRVACDGTGDPADVDTPADLAAVLAGMRARPPVTGR